MTQTQVEADPPLSHLRLTARLNTSALDARRGVVRLHPEAIAALGIREWDAVSLTGSRTTAAVAGVAPAGTPTGTALLDDVTLSNAGLREDTTVIVSAVTVYGARSVTVTGSNLATQSISSATRCRCCRAISAPTFRRRPPPRRWHRRSASPGRRSC